MNEIISYFAGKLADQIPSFILSRLLSPSKVAEQVELDLRGANPICPELNAINPQINLWFKINNFSNLKLILDRLLIDVWFSQPTFSGSILKRYNLPPRGSITDIRYQQSLNNFQKQQIEFYQSTHGTIHIYLTAYFESKVGRIEVNKKIERSNF
jgi:hypothetical protein